MYNSAQCLLELVECVREIAALTPINVVTVTLLARVLDGIADLSALVARKTEFCIRPRTALRIIVNDKPVNSSRRRQPTLRLITTERESNDNAPSPDYVA